MLNLLETTISIKSIYINQTGNISFVCTVAPYLIIKLWHRLIFFYGKWCNDNKKPCLKICHFPVTLCCNLLRAYPTRKTAENHNKNEFDMGIFFFLAFFSNFISAVYKQQAENLVTELNYVLFSDVLLKLISFSIWRKHILKKDYLIHENILRI